jgi:hypothetical protein
VRLLRDRTTRPAGIATPHPGVSVPSPEGPPGTAGARGPSAAPATDRQSVRALRTASDGVLLRLQELDGSVRAGDRRRVRDFDELAASIRELQDRIEAAARREHDLTVVADLVAARRSICSALLLSLGLLGELR